MTDIATAATDALVSGAAGAAAAVVEAGARALSRRIFPPARPRFPLPYDAAAVSYSQIDKFERCARAYWFRYRDPDRRGRAKVSSPEAALGTVTHLAIELLVRYVVDNNAAAEWGPDLARDAWEEAWQRDGTLSGDAAYREGCNMVADYVRVYDAPTDVLDVERHFEIAIPSRATGRVYKLRGAFDRVDKLSARAVRVIDYKSNRLPYTSDDLADDLQMSIYRLAAAECYPWAETADLTFIMLRHGFPQRAERTLDDIESTRRYLANVCDRIFAASDDREEWPTTLSGDCSRCDDRSRCSVFARALLGRGDVVKFRDLSVQLREMPEDMADVEKLIRERTDVGAIAKACYARQKELDEALKAWMLANDAGEVHAAGVRVSPGSRRIQSYGVRATLEILAEVTGRTERDLAGDIVKVDKGKADEIIDEKKRATKDKAERQRFDLAKSRLEATATVEYQTWLDIRPIKGGQKKVDAKTGVHVIADPRVKR